MDRYFIKANVTAYFPNRKVERPSMVWEHFDCALFIDINLKRVETGSLIYVLYKKFSEDLTEFMKPLTEEVEYSVNNILQMSKI